MSFDHSLSVIGAGSYGTALAIAASSDGTPVMLWDYLPSRAEKMSCERKNTPYLPDIVFPSSLSVSSSLEEAVNFSRNILIVVPSSVFKSVTESLKPLLTEEHRLAWATKGFADEKGELLSDTVKEIFKDHSFCPPLAAVSGPTFAGELAAGMPTAIACGGNSPSWVDDLCMLLRTEHFLLYKSPYFDALQLGGAVKNVVAVAAGISDGLGYGANARTALISRGFAEILTLGIAMGISERGFMGLSGMGDLVLTCTDNQSRNRRFGFLLGQGKSAQEAREQIGQVVEACHTAKILKSLAERYKVNMPICFGLCEILNGEKSVKEAAASLMSQAALS